ncbi:hypothetical protein QNN00_15660 [Bacillus velezensis]|nr:hypothetical protein [Bacillus velezensis]
MKRNEDAFPLIDIVETHDELQFLLYLPGYRKQDVQRCPTENISS